MVLTPVAIAGIRVIGNGEGKEGKEGKEGSKHVTSAQGFVHSQLRRLWLVKNKWLDVGIPKSFIKICDRAT